VLITRAGHTVWDSLLFSDLGAGAGTDGQIFVTSGTAATWSSFANLKQISGDQYGFWLGTGAAFSSSNPVLVSDANTFTYVNGPTGGAVGLILADANFLAYFTGSAGYLFGTSTTSAYYYFDNSATAKLHFGLAATSAVIGYDPVLTDVTTHTLTIQGQYAYTTATGTNRVAGNVVVDIGAPTNGANTEANFQVTRNGSPILQVAALGVSPSQIDLWIGSFAFTSSNMAFISDGSTFTYLNAPSTVAVFGVVAGDAIFLSYWNAATDQFFIGGTNTAAPFYFDWANGYLRGGTALGTFTLGTTKAGASLVLQGDNAATVLTITTLAELATGMILDPIVTPSAPSSNKVELYVDSADGYLYAIDSSGNIFTLAA
jgi:hypothetical protein